MVQGAMRPWVFMAEYWIGKFEQIVQTMQREGLTRFIPTSTASSTTRCAVTSLAGMVR